MQSDTSIRIARQHRDALERIKDANGLDSLSDAVALVLAKAQWEDMFRDHEQRIAALEKKR
jgi:hypothetical protein